MPATGLRIVAGVLVLIFGPIPAQYGTDCLGLRAGKFNCCNSFRM